MNQLTEQIVKNKPKQRLSHKRCQELRRRVIKCSTSCAVMGDMMLDFDLELADNESLVYIAQLLVMNENFSAWQYYLKTSLTGDQQDHVKSVMNEHLKAITQERSVAMALSAYKDALKTKGNKYLIKLT